MGESFDNGERRTSDSDHSGSEAKLWRRKGFNLKAVAATLKRRPFVYNVARVIWWAVTLKLTTRLHPHLAFRRKVKIISASGLFDEAWYRSQRKALRDPTIDPIRHYLTKGWRVGLDPHPLFCTTWYIESHADAIERDENPLVHYLAQGGVCNRNPNPYFAGDWYLKQYPDVQRRRINPLVHYIHEGARAGLAPSPGFDAEYYSAANPDVGESDLLPFAHYVRTGAAQGREPNAQIRRKKTERRRLALGTDLTLTTARQVVLGVVTYNNSEEQLNRLLRSCNLALLRAGLRENSALYAIDNGKASNLNQNGVQINLRTFPSRGNIGFGAAHNVLMSEAFCTGGSQYVAVNPDGVLHPDALSAMLRMSEAAENAAIIEAIQVPEEHPKVYDFYSFDTPWASGACMLLPKRIWECIGGFDENFFMYCEDVDISWRARVAGFGVKTCPTALFYHPIGEREPDRNSRQRFLSSGIILAHKWGGETFKRNLLMQMHELGLPSPDLSQVGVVQNAKGVADFDHKFHFAKTRW